MIKSIKIMFICSLLATFGVKAFIQGRPKNIQSLNRFLSANSLILQRCNKERRGWFSQSDASKNCNHIDAFLDNVAYLTYAESCIQAQQAKVVVRTLLHDKSESEKESESEETFVHAVNLARKRLNKDF